MFLLLLLLPYSQFARQGLFGQHYGEQQDSEAFYVDRIFQLRDGVENASILN